MIAPAGTGRLVRHILRRDRLRLAIWIAVLAGMTPITARSIMNLYPDEGDLAAVARIIEGNQAVIAMSGPTRGIDTYGGRITFEVWQYCIAIALMAVFAVVRHTRTEEERGRLELLRAARIGRHAPALAAVLVSIASSLAIGLLVAVGLVGVGLEARGSLLLGVSFGMLGVVFGAVALVAAQVTEHGRSANGIAVGAVFVAYALRAVGDSGPGWVSWTSPFGWIQATGPFTLDRWWPLAIALAATIGLIGLALRLETVRDHGGGLVAPRPGRPAAPGWLSSPFALALRLQRGGMLGWACGIFVGSLAMGAVVTAANDLVSDNAAIKAYLAQLQGATLADLFLATLVAYMALLAAGFAVQSVLRPRAEETAGHAEVVLSRRVSRVRWLVHHIAITLLATVGMLVAAGLGLGGAYGLATQDASQVPRLVVASLAFLPAVGLIASVAVAAFGLRPALSAAAWVVLSFCALDTAFGEVLDFPSWLRDLSPIHRVTGVPAADAPAGTLAVLGLLALALTAAGIVGLRRRDIRSV